MKIRPLTPRERTRWNQWFSASHGAPNRSKEVLYRLEKDFTLYGRALMKLEGLRIWLDRDNNDPLVQFNPTPGISTTCRLCGALKISTLRSRQQIHELQETLHRIALTGCLFWGAESMKDPPWYTTLLWVSKNSLVRNNRDPSLF